MKIIHAVFYLLAGVLCTCQCKKNKIMKDDELYLKRENYTGNQIKIDGYYYRKVNDKFFDGLFLFNNGVILTLGFNWKSSFNEVEEYIIGAYINNTKYKDIKLSWGVFQISGNTIKYEHWYPNSIGPLLAYVHEGTILNDTTFQITQKYRMKDGNKSDIGYVNEIYHFKKFATKPDSTNSFIP